MKLEKLAGATSEIWQIFLQDTSKTDGSGLTGLTSASSGLTAYYHRDTDTTATAIALVSMTLGTFTSGGFKEIDATNMPGWYQFCPPNAAIAAGAKSCAFHLQGATHLAPLPIEVQLVTNYNPDAALQTYPANFAVLAITGGGAVTAGTVSDKTGYSLTQAFPANFAALAIDANGRTKSRVDVQINTALGNLTFLLTDSTLHLPLTGKVNADFTLKSYRLDSSAAATLSGSVSEVDAARLPGVYQVSLLAAELNGGVVTLYFQTADSDPTVVTLVTSA